MMASPALSPKTGDKGGHRLSGAHAKRLQVLQVIDDFGVGPASVGLGHADELAADDPLAVDDVAFRRTGGAEGIAGLVVEVVDGGDAGDVVVDEVLAVRGLVGVEGDGEDDDVGHVLLELHEGGKFHEAGSAPTGPEIEDHDFAAVIAEADGLRAVVDGEAGGAVADGAGVGVAVAGTEHRAQSTERSERERSAESPDPEAGSRGTGGRDHIPIIVGSLERGPTIGAAAFRDHTRS